jgi:hypothetical protein
LPLVEEDEQGLFIMGYRVAPDSGESFSDLKIRSCPVADVNRLSPIVNAFNLHKNGVLDLKQIYNKPTIALIDCLNMLQSTIDEAQARDIERMRSRNGEAGNRN